MTKAPFFSVVMPAYGVEKYLEKAVSSILSQTIKDFEIIIVDDCSKDNSGIIADELSKSNENIKVIHHKENQGLSGARNTGLRAASGRFVFFMDPDDVVEPTLFESVVKALEKSESKVVVFGMVEDYYDANDNLNNSKEIKYCNETLYLDSAEKVRAEVINLEKATFYGYAWNKMYDREYLNKIGATFETVTLIEDIMFNISVFNEIESLIILNTAPYHYMKRMDGSLTNKFVPEYYDLHRRRVATILEQYKAWGLVNDEVRCALGCIYVRYIFSAIQINFDKRSGMNLFNRIRFIYTIYKDELFEELIPVTHSNNKAVKVMLLLLKKHSYIGTLALGRVIYVVKNKMPMIFSRLKQNR